MDGIDPDRAKYTERYKSERDDPQHDADAPIVQYDDKLARTPVATCSERIVHPDVSALRAARMAPPISRVPTVRQPSCLMSAVRKP